MQTLWINNIPTEKKLDELSHFYNDYENLRGYLFEVLRDSHVFDDIPANKKILLKPNWVYHNLKDSDKLCLTTHPDFVLAVLEFVLLLKPSSVIIGDSPVQSCDWGLLHSERFFKKVDLIQKETAAQIRIVDFRNEKWEQKRILQKQCRNENDYVLFDLGADSLLDPLSLQNKSFRVGDYDPRETIKNHSKGTHKYLVAKEVIDADIVINLPKLKTHQKAGITNGLKNLVGTIGEKSFLAHHSSTLSAGGGDCFPGNNIFRKTAEYLREMSFRFKGHFLYYPLHYSSSIIWRLAPKSDTTNLSGAWYGNDTVWRMVLDINRIIAFGNSEGEIVTSAQRRVITICDAIIAGQGEGPLNPSPHAMGMVTVSEDDLFLDYVMSLLFGFDPLKIPHVRSFNGAEKPSEFKIVLDKKTIGIEELSAYSIKAIPPKGWIGYIEKNK